MSHRHTVDQWRMALTTRQARYIIVLAIVISVVPINSTLRLNGCLVRSIQHSNQKSRGANETVWISSKPMCTINLLSRGFLYLISSFDTISVTTSDTISQYSEAISKAIPNSNSGTISDHSHCSTLLQEGGLWLWLCEVVGEHLRSWYVA